MYKNDIIPRVKWIQSNRIKIKDLQAKKLAIDITMIMPVNQSSLEDDRQG